MIVLTNPKTQREPEIFISFRVTTEHKHEFQKFALDQSVSVKQLLTAVTSYMMQNPQSPITQSFVKRVKNG